MVEWFTKFRHTGIFAPIASSMVMMGRCRKTSIMSMPASWAERWVRPEVPKVQGSMNWSWRAPPR